MKEWVDKSRKAFQKSKASECIHFQQGILFLQNIKRRYFRQVLALPSPFDVEWKKMTNISFQVNLLFFTQKFTQHLLNDFLDASNSLKFYSRLKGKFLLSVRNLRRTQTLRQVFLL